MYVPYSGPIIKYKTKVINGNQEENGNNSTHVGKTTQDTSTSSDSSQTTTHQGKTQCGTHGHTICSGPGGSIKHICTKYGIQTYFNGNRTLKQFLVRPKDQDPKEKKSGIIYSYQFRAINCGEEYIGETSMTLGECYKEHLGDHPPSRHAVNLPDIS